MKLPTFAPLKMSLKSSIVRKGRKSKPFIELGRSSRFIRAKEMRNKYTQEELKNTLLPKTKKEIADEVNALVYL